LVIDGRIARPAAVVSEPGEGAFNETSGDGSGATPGRLGFEFASIPAMPGDQFDPRSGSRARNGSLS